jgi:cellulose synthase (UDP-forming)
MAVVDQLRGGFVDFRVTPKGDKVANLVPWQVVMPYVLLAGLSLLPVILVQDAAESAGFYVFALLNAALYCSVFAIIVRAHAVENQLRLSVWQGRFATQAVSLIALVGVMVFGVFEHSQFAMAALAATKGEVQLTRSQSIVAGAGQGASGQVQLVYNPEWLTQLLSPNSLERLEK